MEKQIKPIVPEDIFLSILPDYAVDEAAKWSGKVDTTRPGRYLTGYEVLDAFVDLLHQYRFQNPGFYVDKLGFERNDLNGFMRVVSGLSLKEWRNRYILLMAKEMLEKTSMSVNEISQELRFATYFSFCRWFHEQSDRQPVEWRRGFRTGTKRMKFHYCD